MLAALLLAYNTLVAMVFAGTIRYRVPWDFVLAVLAAFALERAGTSRGRRTPARARPVELGGPVGAAILRELRERALATGRAHARRHVPGRRRARRSPARAHGIARRHEQAGLAVGDDLRQPADGARDHRSAALHRLERDHAEALAERRDDDDRGALQHRPGGRDPPEERTARRARGARRRAELARSGPSPAISSVERGDVEASARERIEQRVVTLDRDEPADAPRAGRAGSGGGGSGPGAIP